MGVAALTTAIKENLEQAFGYVAVEGEIGAMTRHRSGHWYFNLIEGKVTLNAVMFRGNNQRVNWQPEVGDKVVCIGGIDVYAPHGKYNLLVRNLMPSGAGARARALEQLKERLTAEGLFSDEHKQRLPYLPSAIGVATSATGAALQDILNVLGRRFPGVKVILAACRVQGEDAAREIADALSMLNAHGECDVIIVGRGGGSIEDLWAFNEEEVVRAIAQSAIPVVSAVGHETDVTLADLVADVRAPTPSAAAELVVPEQAALLQLLDEYWERQVTALTRLLHAKRERLGDLRLVHPGQRLVEQRRRLTDVESRLGQVIQVRLAARKSELSGLAGRLDALSPLAVLSRGYAIVHRGQDVVRSAQQLQAGDVMRIRFSDGEVQGKIQD